MSKILLTEQHLNSVRSKCLSDRRSSRINGSVFLANIYHAYAQTDGTYDYPNTREGDMLRQAKCEIEFLIKEINKKEINKLDVQNNVDGLKET